MKFVPNKLTVLAGRQLLVAKKNSPQILLTSGIVGVVGSTVLACKATLKLEGVLDDGARNVQAAENALTNHSDQYTEADYRKDMALIRVQNAAAVAKLYAPAFVLGTLSISAIVGSHNIMSRRNAAITAAYAAMEKGFEEYKKRVAEEFGEDKERELRYETTEKQVTLENGKKTKMKVLNGTGYSPYAKFYDEYAPNWQPQPSYNLHFIRCQQNWANDMLLSRGHLFLNEVYDALGLDRTKEGAVVGWVLGKGGDDYVDFGLYNGESEAVREFVNGREPSILLDFNVDGVIYDKI